MTRRETRLPDWKWSFVALALVAACVGCSLRGDSHQARKPGSVAPEFDNRLMGYAQEDLRLQKKMREYNEIFGTRHTRPEDFIDVMPEMRDQFRNLQDLVNDIRETGKRREALRDELRGYGASGNRTISLREPPATEKDYYPVEVREPFMIEELASLPLVGGKPRETYVIENTQYDFSLSLKNEMPLPESVKQELAARRRFTQVQGFDPKDYRLHARIRCDKPVSIVRPFASDYSNVTDREFVIAHGEMSGGEVRVRFPSEEVSCELLFRRNGDKEYVAGTRIVTNKTLSSEGLAGHLREICLHEPRENGFSSARDLMDNVSLPGIGCQQPVEHAELMQDPVDAFAKKAGGLLGQPIPRDIIEKGLFKTKLDFSKAPKFDLIVLTALEYKVDFSGKIFDQILRYHAQRGTQVRIILPGISAMTFDNELSFLKDLVRSNRNIRLQYYVYGKGAASQFNLNRLHRVIHAKVLVGISSQNPSASFAVTGGRNIKDTFLYKKAPLYRSEPGMTQYAGTDGREGEVYIFYEDLEILVKGDAIAKQVASQLLAFWHRDYSTMGMRPSSVHLEIPGMAPNPMTGPRARHIISVPQADDRQLEDFYVQMFDSSRKILRIVSPYFRPTQKIAAALERALKRGVTIDFTTRLNLAGDNSPGITADMNRMSTNKYYSKINVYAWNAPDSILHPKTVLIDDEVLFIGGTNLNNRSFTHDVESGILIADPKVAAQFREIYEKVYVPGSDHIQGHQKVKAIHSLLEPIVGGFF